MRPGDRSLKRTLIVFSFFRVCKGARAAGHKAGFFRKSSGIDEKCGKNRACFSVRNNIPVLADTKPNC